MSLLMFEDPGPVSATVCPLMDKVFPMQLLNVQWLQNGQLAMGSVGVRAYGATLHIIGPLPEHICHVSCFSTVLEAEHVPG